MRRYARCALRELPDGWIAFRFGLGRTSDKGCGDEQRHGCGDHDAQQDDERLAFGGHRQHREDASGRRRSHQPRIGEREKQQSRGAARDCGNDQYRTGEYVGKIDFVDAAEKLDNHGSRSRLARISPAEKPVCEQYAQSGTGVGFEQEHDRLPRFAGLFDADRREDSVIDGVVEKQHLGRLHEKRHKRQQSVAYDQLGTAAYEHRQAGDHAADNIVAQNGQQHAENADREVADEHFEACLHAPLDHAVEPADRISRQRTHDHRADEHRNIAADDHADGGNGADHPAPLPGDVAPCGVGDQQRQEVGQHRPDQLCELSVGPPSLRDEKRGDESPRDERADIGHDHAAQGPAELLDLLSHNFVSCLYIQAKRDYHLFETEKNGALFIKKPSSTGGRSYKTERTAAICRNWRRYNRRA